MTLSHDKLSRLRHAALACACTLACPARADTAPADNFANLSLEELSNIQITSVSKKAQRLGDTAASVFVIRGDDIRRAGATTLPEALRLAPNLQVARVDARNYAVTARGFNNVFNNKLLVLIDGRTVYSPLFSGAFWDVQDMLLDDVERIEVISGPGATIWGANAVNGVINIITRSALETQGGYATLGADRDNRSGAMRYGAHLANGMAWRVYGKVIANDDTLTASGLNTHTGWRRHQAGFRIDGDLAGNALTLSGDAYHGSLHQANTRDIEVGGANLLARVERELAPGSSLRVQAYVDHTERDQPNAFIEHLTTVDLEIQHTLMLTPSQQLVWGGEQRSAFDHLVNGPGFGFLPAESNLSWTNLFAQDEVRLGEDLRLTAGLKIERNSYTGREHLPYLSLAWQVAPKHLLWSSLARAVRVPSRIERDFYAPTSGKPTVVYGGSPNFMSEVARVAQLGYRGEPAAHLSYALTMYYSRYDKVRTLEPNPGGTSLVAYMNKAEGSSRGLEMSGSWDVRRDWRLTAGMVAQRLAIHDLPGSKDTTAPSLANNDPSNWSMLRSSYDWSENVEVDMTLRHVGALPKPVVPAYNALDVRVGWKLGRNVEASLLVQNLLAADHAEWGAPALRNVYRRSLFGRVSWRF
ncbi:MAG: TonB-dependent receptor [Pseudomonadota bacterium]